MNFLITYHPQTLVVLSLESSPTPYETRPATGDKQYVVYTFHETSSEIVHKMGCDARVVFHLGTFIGLMFRPLDDLYVEKAAEAEKTRVAHRFSAFMQLQMLQAFTTIENHPSVREMIDTAQSRVDDLSASKGYELPDYIADNRDMVFK